ncbi:MAG: hypothetical protein AAGI50_00215 [Pseudomonadota bacterium]
MDGDMRHQPVSNDEMPYARDGPSTVKLIPMIIEDSAIDGRIRTQGSVKTTTIAPCTMRPQPGTGWLIPRPGKDNALIVKTVDQIRMASSPARRPRKSGAISRSRMNAGASPQSSAARTQSSAARVSVVARTPRTTPGV